MRLHPFYLIPILLLCVTGCAQDGSADVRIHPELTVVRITDGRGEVGPGSGFLVSESGLLVTSRRLISSSAKINVTLHDGRTVPATMVEEDREAEVILLKIPGSHYPFLHLRDEDIEPVMPVRVIGVDHQSQGVFDHWEETGRLIGFTARVTPADAGAPLLADDGQVIGIVAGKLDATGSVQLATPVWHITRMLPADGKWQKSAAADQPANP